MGSALVYVLRFWRTVGFSRDELSLKCLTTGVCRFSVVKTFLAIATDSLLCFKIMLRTCINCVEEKKLFME